MNIFWFLEFNIETNGFVHNLSEANGKNQQKITKRVGDLWFFQGRNFQLQHHKVLVMVVVFLNFTWHIKLSILEVVDSPPTRLLN